MKNRTYYENKNYALKQKLNEIRRYTNDKNFTIAFQLLNDLSEEFSNNPYYIFEMGFYYYSLYDYDKALEYFESLENSKNKYYAIYYIGLIKLQRHDYDEAMEEFNKIVNSNHKDKGYAELAIAEIYRCKAEYDNAIKILSEIIDKAIIDNNQRLYITAILNKANILVDKKEYVIAQDLINNVLGQIKRKELFDKALYILAYIEYENDNFESCQKYLNRISSGNVSKMMLEARVLYKQCKYLESKAICQSLYKYPDFYLFACSLNAKNNIRLKLYDETKQELEKIIQQNKANGSLYYDLGLLYFSKQDFEKALECLNYVIENISNMKNLAIQKSIYANIKLNRIQEAYNLYIKFIKCDIFNDNPRKEILLRAYFSKYIAGCQSYESDFYSCNQIENYSEESAIDHIYKRHSVNQIDDEKHTIFSNKVNIRQLFIYAKNHISSADFYDNNFFDEYIIKLDDCTLDINNSMKGLKVITIPNTNDIITMYPCKVYEITIENKEEFISKPYVKTSQIDKFKKRYGMK